MNRWLVSFIAALLLISGVEVSGATTDLPSSGRDEQICAGACAPHQSDPVQLALVFKEDDRRVLNDVERRRFNAVGIIISSEGVMGSGAIVMERDIVVTSAHLFFEDGKLHHPIDTYSFAISDGSGDWTRKKEYRIAEIVVGTKYVDNNIGRDWAVLRLRQDVDEAVQPLQIGSLADDELDTTVQNIAFHGDLSNGGVPHITTCRFEKPDEGFVYKEKSYDKSNVLIHDCDIIGGASGGPFVVTERGKDYLVAINQGFFQAYALPGKLKNVFLPGVMFNVAVAANAEMIRSVEQMSQQRRTVRDAPSARRSVANPQRTSVKEQPAFPGSLSVPDRLRALQDLLKRGLITEEEAAAKRRQILKDL